MSMLVVTLEPTVQHVVQLTQPWSTIRLPTGLLQQSPSVSLPKVETAQFKLSHEPPLEHQQEDNSLGLSPAHFAPDMPAILATPQPAHQQDAMVEEITDMGPWRHKHGTATCTSFTCHDPIRFIQCESRPSHSMELQGYKNFSGYLQRSRLPPFSSSQGNGTSSTLH